MLMRTLFIEASYSKKIKLPRSIEKKLPKKIGLVSSIQFLKNLPLIKNQLKNKKVLIAGKVLGCNVKRAEKIKNIVDAFLYIGDGKFHPLGVAIKTKKPVFVYNPLQKSFYKIEKEELEQYLKRKKGALIRFLKAGIVGVIISTKPGQYYPIEKLGFLKRKYPKKRFYLFLADTIDYNQLENFPFIEAWINTACPRIDEDIKIINISDLDCS